MNCDNELWIEFYNLYKLDKEQALKIWYNAQRKNKTYPRFVRMYKGELWLTRLGRQLLSVQKYIIDIRD